MQHIAFLLFFTLAIVASGADRPKIATVNMEIVFGQYQKKSQAKARNLEQLEKLAKDPRIAAVRELDAQLKELAATVRDKSLSDEVREKAAMTFNSLSSEYTSLTTEMESFLQNEKRKLTLEFVQEWEKLLAEAEAVTAKIGREGGYELVLEIGGKSSSMMPTVLHLSDSTDITELVIQRLNDPDEPQ